MRFAISMCLTPPNPAAQRRPADLVAIRFVLRRSGFPGEGRPGGFAGAMRASPMPPVRLTLGDHSMQYHAINFAQKLGLFIEQWQPKVIAEMNDYQFKVVKLQRSEERRVGKSVD